MHTVHVGDLKCLVAALRKEGETDEGHFKGNLFNPAYPKQCFSISWTSKLLTRYLTFFRVYSILPNLPPLLTEKTPQVRR